MLPVARCLLSAPCCLLPAVFCLLSAILPALCYIMSAMPMHATLPTFPAADMSDTDSSAVQVKQLRTDYEELKHIY
jgi:hypothetical protein